MISLEFFGILILSLILYWLLPRQRLRNLLLTCSSFIYIGLLDLSSLYVVVALSLWAYLWGILTHRLRPHIWPQALGVIGLLAALIFFKYLGMLSGISLSLYLFLEALPSFSLHHLLLPLGISYIVFKQISYLIDIRWGLVKPGSLTDFLLYSSLFTIFVAGPIERFERFLPQIKVPAIGFDPGHLREGLRRISIGLFKKLVIADWIGYLISPIWHNPQGFPAWLRLLALVAYALQIYYDFAGYSDIAIGASRLFGLRIMENFKRPYMARNISDFWRRWHISLSDWIRDYLFFPLSGICKNKAWLIFGVPVIAMGLCGLWHGADMRFLIWGIWHGLGLAFLQYFKIWEKKRSKATRLQIRRLLQRLGPLITLTFVTFGWLSFRVFGLKLGLSLAGDLLNLLLLPGVLILLWIGQALAGHLIRYLEGMRWTLAHSIWLLILVGIAFCAGNTEFIYAGF